MDAESVFYLDIEGMIWNIRGMRKFNGNQPFPAEGNPTLDVPVIDPLTDQEG